ncbi:MAG: tetratricopeptide repeat protein [Gemmatimonadota bacterium]
MKTDALKEEARRFEQREEWGKALELYLQAIERQADEDEPEIALHNRVGDLQLRLGDVLGAVSSYNQAISLYLDAGLPNNAIAVCRKIIRNDPRRPDAFLRMARIRASQGLVVDARQNFLTYAEMMQAKGKSEEAIAALEELIAAARDDAETRELLADRLLRHERLDDALARLKEAYRIHARAGDEENASRILDRLRELAPDQPLPDADGPFPATPEFEEVPRDEAAGLAGFETTALGGEAEPEAAAREDEAAPVSGLEPAHDMFRTDAEAEFASGAETEAESEVPREWDDDLVSAEAEIEPEEDSSPLPFLTADAAELVGTHEDAEDYEEGPESWEAEAALELPDLVPALRERVASDPADGEGWLLLARELLEGGNEVEGGDALHRAHQAYAAGGDPRAAMQVAEELLILQPTRLDLRQRVVEYAHMTGDQDLLLDAFMELASALHGTGDTDHARAVLERIVKLAPGHERAGALLAEITPRQAPPPTKAAQPRAETSPPAKGAPPASPPSGDYVDLGALVLDEKGEETTRWVVPADAPSADEDADFKRTLQQFKAKVAENLSVDDAKAHYDLGTAYKEMGLMEEAIGEFQQALRADPANLAAFEVLGQCFLEKGEPQAAIRTLERGLRLPIQVEDDLLGIYYCLGNSHEVVGNTDSAKEFYERIFALDINFKDVTDRLRDLR